MLDSCYKGLGVPDNAERMDVLVVRYQWKNGKVILKSTGPFKALNADLRAFTEKDALCLADSFQKFTIPFESLTGIRSIRKRIAISNWNKDEPYNQGEYKPYHIKGNQYGGVILPYYYALGIRYNGEEYELYFPPYELAAVERLTGCRMEEE